MILRSATIVETQVEDDRGHDHRRTAMIITTPAAGIAHAPFRVVEDHVERAAVVGRRLDRLDHLVLRREQQRQRRRGRPSRPRRCRRSESHAGHDRVGGVEHAAQQVDDHRQRRRAAGSRRRSIPGSSRPPLGDDRRLGGDPRQSAATITSNCALIALTAGSSGRRCSDSTPSRASASVASLLGGRLEPGPDPDQRARPARRRSRPATPGCTVRTGQGGRTLMPAHRPVAVGERVHVAVLDDGLLARSARAPARWPAAGGCWRCWLATLPATSSSAEAERSMSSTARMSMTSSAATASAATQADDQGDAPGAVVGEGARSRHFPTATLRRARAECRIRTPESLIAPDAVERVGLAHAPSRPRRPPSAPDRRSCWPGRTIVITIAAATITTTTPSTIPTSQPVEAPMYAGIYNLHPSSRCAGDPHELRSPAPDRCEFLLIGDPGVQPKGPDVRGSARNRCSEESR